jgi:hypothetical protein
MWCTEVWVWVQIHHIWGDISCEVRISSRWENFPSHMTDFCASSNSHIPRIWGKANILSGDRRFLAYLQRRHFYRVGAHRWALHTETYLYWGLREGQGQQAHQYSGQPNTTIQGLTNSNMSTANTCCIDDCALLIHLHLYSISMQMVTEQDHSTI